MELICTRKEGYFLSDKEFAELYEEFANIDMEPCQREIVKLGLPICPPSDKEDVHLMRIHKILLSVIESVMDAFNYYYEWSEEERRRTERLYPAVLRGALYLTRPDYVAQLKELRRQDVYPTFWHILLVDNLKVLLWALTNAGIAALDAYEELDKLGDAALAARFEEEWHRLYRCRDDYNGFFSVPKFSVTHVVRYLTSKHWHRDIRRQTSDYLLHLCQERPFVLEALTPLFKERAFRDRVKAAYQPLTDKVVSTILRDSGATKQEAQGSYGKEIRARVEEAFDKFLREFDYYFKRRPQELVIPRWCGMLGGIPDEQKKIAEELSQLPAALPADWDRELAFSHYIQQKLRRIVREEVGPDHPWKNKKKKPQLPHDDILCADDESDSESGDQIPGEIPQIFKGEAKRRGKQRPRNGFYDESYERDAQGFLKTKDMADFMNHEVGIYVSPRQLRDWAKQGLVPAARAQDYLPAKLPVRRNHWLFRDDEETISAISDTARSRRMPSQAAPGGMIARARVAKLLEISEKTLRKRESEGWLTPQPIRGSVYYTLEEVKRLKDRPPSKIGRPRKRPPK